MTKATRIVVYGTFNGSEETVLLNRLVDDTEVVTLETSKGYDPKHDGDIAHYVPNGSSSFVISIKTPAFGKTEDFGLAADKKQKTE